MFKKLGKLLGFVVVAAAAVAGGMALYNKYKKSEEDFDDFDDFDDDDFDDDFSDLDIENRGYTSLNSENENASDDIEVSKDTIDETEVK